MSVAVTVTVHNAGPHTIWGKLAARLGREPTHEEAKAEVKRILREGLVDCAERRDLKHQK